MILTKKIGIYPTHEQENVLLDLSEKCRLIYNFALSERKEWWKRNKDLLYEEPLVNGDLERTFLSRLHRYTAPPVIEAVVDSMETLPLEAG